MKSAGYSSPPNTLFPLTKETLLWDRRPRAEHYRPAGATHSDHAGRNSRVVGPFLANGTTRSDSLNPLQIPSRPVFGPGQYGTITLDTGGRFRSFYRCNAGRRPWRASPNWLVCLANSS